MAKSLDIIDPKREMNPQDSGNNDRNDRDIEEKPERERSGSGIFYLILGIIAVVVSTALAVYILFKDNKTTDSTKATPTATVALTQDNSKLTTQTTSATATVSTSTSATASTATGTFKYSNESIRIANGNSKSGEAGRIKTALEAKGFKISSTGNASKQYAQTTILYKAGEQALADALKAAIASDYTAIVEQSDQATLGSYDAIIALGAK